MNFSLIIKIRMFISLYSKLKKEEEERELEWAKKYRDRV